MVVLKFNVYSAKDMEGKLMRTLKQKISVSLDEDIITKIKELYPLHNETSGLLFNYYLVYFSIIIYTCYRVESSDYRGFGCTVSICLVAGRSRTRRRNR